MQKKKDDEEKNVCIELHFISSNIIWFMLNCTNVHLYYKNLFCHSALPSLLKYRRNWSLVIFALSVAFLVCPLLRSAVLPLPLRSPNVIVPLFVSPMSKHSDDVSDWVDVFGRKLCNAQHVITTASILSSCRLIKNLRGFGPLANYADRATAAWYLF
jgi:hypothetical protein